MFRTNTSSPSSMAAKSLMVFAAIITLATAADSSVGPPVKIAAPNKRASPVYSGCYSSSGNLTESASYTWQSSGWCQGNCLNQTNAAVIGLTNGGDCWCGDALPPSSSKVGDSKCSTVCDGFGQEKCGGPGYWTVYNIGTGTIGQSSTSTKPQVVTSIAPGQTVVVTQQADANSKGGKSASTAGVAAGIVVGIVGFAAICGGVYLYLRRRRQRLADEEFRRNNQVSDFMRGSDELKPPPSAYSSMSDSRLDPITGRRDSSGSLADAQDYSRRILRVANPDR